MPYDKAVAERIETLLKARRGFVSKKLFGGIGYLLNGNLCVCVWKEFLIVRVGPEAYPEALADRFTREFDVTGRAMTGWVMVKPEGLALDTDLEHWVEMAVAFVRTLPGK